METRAGSRGTIRGENKQMKKPENWRVIEPKKQKRPISRRVIILYSIIIVRPAMVGIVDLMIFYTNTAGAQQCSGLLCELLLMLILFLFLGFNKRTI